MSKRRKWTSSFICVVLSLMSLLGFCAKRHFENKWSFFYLFFVLFTVAIWWELINVIYSILQKKDFEPIKRLHSMSGRNLKLKRISFWGTFVLLLIVWGIAFFAFYPGLFVYDAQWQYFMYINGEVTTHHPVLHTYLLGWIIDTVYSITGSINKGIAAYTILQMLIMGLGCAYVLDYFIKKRFLRWLLIFSFVFFAFFPTLVIFVFSSTKDSLFAIAVADFVLLNLNLFSETKTFFEKKGNIVLWIVFALEVCILRNNAIYAIICTLPVFVVFLTKANCNKIKAFGMLIVTIVIFLIYKYPVTNALTVDGTSKAEMLSVPCQQIIRVYKYHFDELDDSDKEKVETLFDDEKWYGYYVPEIADATKGSLRMEVYEADSSLFWGLWKDWLFKYPKEYIISFLENTYGFWYPWPHYVIYSFGGEGYTPITTMEPGEQNSHFPLLFEFYKNFENGDIVQGMPWISWIFAPATYFYFMLIVAGYVLIKGNLKYGIPFIFVILLWCTYLLGPAAMVRYALYLYYLVPVWLAYCITINKKEIGIDD